MSKRPRKPNSGTTDQPLSTPPPPPSRLPPSLDRLHKLFQQLVPFCAFCEARLTTAMTFQRMKDAVPDLSVNDLAAIKTIVPDFIHYDYTTSSSTDNGIATSDTATATATTTSTLHVQFGKPVSHMATKAKHSRAMNHRGDAPSPSSSSSSSSLPMVKSATILKTIQKNNTLFTKALDAFVDTHGYSHSETVLKERLAQYILPEPSPLPPLAASISPDDQAKASASDRHPPSRPCMEIMMDELRQQLQSPKGGGNQQQQQQQQHRTIYQTTVAARSAQYAPSLLRTDASATTIATIKQALQEKGIDQLYVHQAKAIDAFINHNHVITSTSTSSGKSLIYQMAMYEALYENPSARALLVFPTKALAQDQRRSFMDWLTCLGLNDIKVSTYDGDTPMDQRATIRSSSQVILTNPDMLHYSILPNAAKYWRDFFPFLKLIVIDEIHVYHGAFGANMAFILRRLRRVIIEIFHNQRVQFISCSATISNPKVHMEQLVGISKNVVAIHEDGAPNALKTMVLWNPPLIDASQGVRRGAIAETVDILAFLMSRQLRCIVFCKLRKTCEMLMKQMREHLDAHTVSKVHSYRGGYMPSTRRRIEQQIFRGDILAIIATNALELGIDIGQLDAVIMVGVPWSLSNFWQQSGRAGRRNHESLTMVVADQNPMDQYYVKHPQDLFEKEIPPLQLQLNQSMLLKGHLQCAAQELAIHIDRDETYFGSQLGPLCRDHLIYHPDVNIYRPHPSHLDNPWQDINIRGMMEEEMYAIVDITHPNNKIILEEIEATRAPFEVYVGAIFIHQGRTYLVDDLNVDLRYATVHLIQAAHWTTRQRDFTNVNILETKKRKPILSSSSLSSSSRRHPVGFVSFGQVEIETVVFGYHKLDIKTNRILDTLDIYMDPILRQGLGLWVDLPGSIVHLLETHDIDLMAAVHAASHMLIIALSSSSPWTTTTTTTGTRSYIGNEIRTECKSPHATRKRPNRVVVYEATPCGVLRSVYDGFESLVKTCQQTLDACECSDGCPKCIFLSSCSEHNIVCSKLGAQFIFRSLLEMDP